MLSNCEEESITLKFSTFMDFISPVLSFTCTRPCTASLYSHTPISPFKDG